MAGAFEPGTEIAVGAGAGGYSTSNLGSATTAAVGGLTALADAGVNILDAQSKTTSKTPPKWQYAEKYLGTFAKETAQVASALANESDPTKAAHIRAMYTQRVGQAIAQHPGFASEVMAVASQIDSGFVTQSAGAQAAAQRQAGVQKFIESDPLGKAMAASLARAGVSPEEAFAAMESKMIELNLRNAKAESDKARIESLERGSKERNILETEMFRKGVADLTEDHALLTKGLQDELDMQNLNVVEAAQAYTVLKSTAEQLQGRLDQIANASNIDPSSEDYKHAVKVALEPTLGMLRLIETQFGSNVTPEGLADNMLNIERVRIMTLSGEAGQLMRTGLALSDTEWARIETDFAKLLSNGAKIKYENLTANQQTYLAILAENNAASSKALKRYASNVDDLGSEFYEWFTTADMQANPEFIYQLAASNEAMGDSVNGPTKVAAGAKQLEKFAELNVAASSSELEAVWGASFAKSIEEVAQSIGTDSFSVEETAALLHTVGGALLTTREKVVSGADRMIKGWLPDGMKDDVSVDLSKPDGISIKPDSVIGKMLGPGKQNAAGIRDTALRLVSRPSTVAYFRDFAEKNGLDQGQVIKAHQAIIDLSRNLSKAKFSTLIESGKWVVGKENILTNIANRADQAMQNTSRINPERAIEDYNNSISSTTINSNSQNGAIIEVDVMGEEERVAVPVEQMDFGQVEDALLPHIKEWEGLRLEAYKDVAGIWTIGYGHTGDVKEGDTITEEEAMELYREDSAEAREAVLSELEGIELTPNQVAALVSLTYNIGSGAFKGSTLLRKLKEGDMQGAADQFLVWNKATINGQKKTVRGLVNRRKAERELFLA